MKIVSDAFSHNQSIPKLFTADGEDISPPLAFSDVPSETKSFALIVDDPDAPNGTFDHWVAWNIPASTASLSAGAKVPNEGKNHYGELHYRGPNPPKGKPHRYFFKLYALDSLLNLSQGVEKQELEEALAGHVLAKAELIGIYQRR